MRILTVFSVFLLVACTSPKKQSMHPESFTFLALGDSYTIGEAVEEQKRWPQQLVQKLLEDSIKLETTIIAKTGWTTDELQLEILKAGISKSTFDMVSLLIGVNNQYRGYPVDQYEKEFKQLLDQAIQFAGGNPHDVVVVSIPDYGVTPFVESKQLDEEKIAKEIHNYNAIAEKITILRDVTFINITPGSKEAKNDPSLIAEDGLHPSGKMYEQWVNEMYEYIFNNLSAR